MKLAEALQERADINRNIEQLRNRLNNNVLVQEGEKPAEEPEKLKQELDGQTLTELIAKKDVLSLKIRVYKEIVGTGSQTSYRVRSAEIKIKSAISVAEWQAEIDKMAKELRLLDNKLQQSNWNTDLIE